MFSLFPGFNAILLWSNEIKQCLGATIQFMKFTILALIVPSSIENREKESPMVESAILNV
jgi:hypothetical protein